VEGVEKNLPAGKETEALYKAKTDEIWEHREIDSRCDGAKE